MVRTNGVRLVMACLLLGALVAYFLVDPEDNALFPACPFHWATGLLCPGCGSQRALHHLLHLRFDQAFVHNPALLAAPALLGIQWGLGLIRGAPLANDNRVVWAWGIALVGWGIVRNLPGLYQAAS